jgi:hypothetical protein
MTDASKLMTEKQAWRLNSLGLLSILDEPAEPIERDEAKEILAAAAVQGLWQPAARGARGVNRWDSVNS